MLWRQAPPDDEVHEVSNMQKKKKISQLALENVKFGKRISQNLCKATNFML